MHKFRLYIRTSNMKIFIIASLVAVAIAAELPAYPKPAGYPSPAPYSKPADYAPMPYDFAWAVKDDYYNDYAHQATADDKGYVQGSYRVLLPDGRTQVVNYKADGYNGYTADVKYEGEAKYDYKPAYNKPAAYPAAVASYPAPTAGYPAAAPSYPAPAYPAPKYPAANKY